MFVKVGKQMIYLQGKNEEDRTVNNKPLIFALGILACAFLVFTIFMAAL